MKSHINTVGNICAYRINNRDEIIGVDDNWKRFAEENDAPDACFAPHLIESVLWDHICDPETLHLYRLLLTKVRKTQVPITLPLRCDAPELKRYIELTLIPEPDGIIAFESRIVRIEPCPPVALLDVNQPRSKEMIRMCSFCQNIDLGNDRWVEPESAIILMGLFNNAKLPRLTHTICPKCYQAVMAKYE